MVNTEFETIEKEMISALRFPQEEVLKDPIKIKERASDLDKALSLGNLEHSKIKIFFEDEQSCKIVETTVWAVTDKQVILKQGVSIPINRIHSVAI